MIDRDPSTSAIVALLEGAAGSFKAIHSVTGPSLIATCSDRPAC